MRYYSIILSSPATGQVIQTPASVAQESTYSSYANGQTIPGALNIEIDIWQAPQNVPTGASYVRIWGISLQEIGQASNLNGANVSIFAGMQAGLPLANPAEAGLIVRGMVFQAFGNWINTDMTLDLILQPSIGTTEAPKNIVINWKAGTPLSQAIAQTLSTAFPGVKQNINISPNLVLSHDAPGYYQTAAQFADYVRRVSVDIVGGNYQGVNIVFDGTSFSVYDGTATPPTPKQIAFQDMIGQPTWIYAPFIQVKSVMRGDLHVGDYITLPPSIVTTTAAAQSSLLNLKANFQGTFQINSLHHVGNFRQPDAASWVTVINAYPTQVQ